MREYGTQQANMQRKAEREISKGGNKETKTNGKKTVKGDG